MSRVYYFAAIAVTASSGLFAQTQRAEDNGDPQNYSKRVYVDNEAAVCTSAANGCGTQSKPFSNLPSAMSAVVPGTELIIAGGSKPYYGTPDGMFPSNKRVARGVINFGNLSVGPTQARTIARKWAGTPNPVIIRGTLNVKGWKSVSGADVGARTYYKEWDYTGDARPGVVFEPQQVYNGVVPLTQVGGKVFYDYAYPSPAGSQYASIEADVGGSLWPGRIPVPAGSEPWRRLGQNQFYFDTTVTPHRLYVRLSDWMPWAGLEVGAYMHAAFGAEYPRNIYNLTLKDINFERVSTSAFSRGGALSFVGKGLIFDGIKVSYGDAHCMAVSGENIEIKNSVFEMCGQGGLIANGRQFKIANNIVRKNNSRGFEKNWEAGGMKFIGGAELLQAQSNAGVSFPLASINGLDGSEISLNRIYDNSGHGLWLDTDNRDNAVANNVLAYNEIGLYLEINANNKVTGNQIIGNFSHGIQLKDAGDELRGNVIVGNMGFGLVMSPDTRQINAGDSGFLPYGNSMVDNRFAWNNAEIHKLEISLMVDPANLGMHPQVVYGNRYCAPYSQYALYKLAGSGQAPVEGSPAHGLGSWNGLLSSVSTGTDSSAVTSLPYPQNLRDLIASKAEVLVNAATTGSLWLQNYAVTCGFNN